MAVPKDLIARYEYPCPGCEGQGWVYLCEEYEDGYSSSEVTCAECEGDRVQFTEEGRELLGFLNKYFERRGRS